MQILAEMKLCFGVEVNKVLRTNLSKIANKIFNKVAAGKKSLDAEAEFLITCVQKEENEIKRKGNKTCVTLFIVFFISMADNYSLLNKSIFIYL